MCMLMSAMTEMTSRFFVPVPCTHEQKRAVGMDIVMQVSVDASQP